MTNNLFVLTKNTAKVTTITAEDVRYIAYNEYLQKEYFTNVEENEDFIPMLTGTEVIIVLAIDENVEPIEAEDVFEVLQNTLYCRA